MKFKYTTAIDKILKMDNTLKIVQGGSSAGKTIAILAILIDTALKNKNILISVVSATMPHLKKGCIRDFINLLKTTNRWNDNYWNRSNYNYTFGNDSVIEFFSTGDSKGGKLRGARRQILYINECNLIDLESFNELKIRTSELTFVDYNPTNQFWIQDFLDDKNSSFIKLNYKDNEALPNNVIEDFEYKQKLAETSEYWKNWCKVYIDGEFGSLQGTIFNFKVIDKIPKEANYLGVGLDFGYNDPNAAVEVYRLNDKLFIKEVLYKPEMTNTQLYNNLKVYNYIIGDSARPEIISDLRSRGLNIRSCKKGKGSILFGIQLLQEFELNITRNSINLMNELNSYTWKKDNKNNNINVPIDDYNHLIDALRYITTDRINNSTNKPQFRVVNY